MRVHFSFEDYINYLTPTLQRFVPHETKDLDAYLSNDEINCGMKIFFVKSSVNHSSFAPKQVNPALPSNPPESLVFKLLKRHPPRFQEQSPYSFHGLFYQPGEQPLITSSRFHPLEENDVDLNLPWRVELEKDISVELGSEVSHQEYLKQRQTDNAKFKRNMHPTKNSFFTGEASQRFLSFCRGVEIPPPSTYD